jgi:hypothetical protein
MLAVRLLHELRRQACQWHAGEGGCQVCANDLCITVGVNTPGNTAL